VREGNRSEAFLKDLANAAHLLSLYPAEHPRARQALVRIEQELPGLLASRPEVSILFMDKRVVVDGLPVRSGDTAARGLGRTLRARGKDRMTIHRGATVAELWEFLGALTSAEVQESWCGTTHIRLDSLRAGVLAPDLSTYGSALGDGAEGFLAVETGALGAVWDGVTENGRIETGLLEGVVAALSRVVTENVGAMLPLAPLKSHDQYTFTHIINVGILSMGLSEAIGMPPQAVKDVGIAALLHDVGKSLVPAEILNKPDRLTDLEFDVIKRHPVDGARLLLRTPGVPELAVSVAYEHHVRHDGGGYPILPAGWRPSLASAITQIADFYDALRTHRPYRRGMPREKILEIMKKESARHFEPELLRAFFDAVCPREATSA
jgi:putative nucleotidyltransferase with HDIG domain